MTVLQSYISSWRARFNDGLVNVDPSRPEIVLWGDEESQLLVSFRKVLPCSFMAAVHPINSVRFGAIISAQDSTAKGDFAIATALRIKFPSLTTTAFNSSNAGQPCMRVFSWVDYVGVFSASKIECKSSGNVVANIEQVYPLGMIFDYNYLTEENRAQAKRDFGKMNFVPIVWYETRGTPAWKSANVAEMIKYNPLVLGHNIPVIGVPIRVGCTKFEYNFTMNALNSLCHVYDISEDGVAPETFIAHIDYVDMFHDMIDGKPEFAAAKFASLSKAKRDLVLLTRVTDMSAVFSNTAVNIDAEYVSIGADVDDTFREGLDSKEFQYQLHYNKFIVDTRKCQSGKMESFNVGNIGQPVVSFYMFGMPTVNQTNNDYFNFTTTDRTSATVSNTNINLYHILTNKFAELDDEDTMMSNIEIKAESQARYHDDYAKWAPVRNWMDKIRPHDSLGGRVYTLSQETMKYDPAGMVTLTDKTAVNITPAADGDVYIVLRVVNLITKNAANSSIAPRFY